jgi:uncharacterized membrane-anchored protein YhcB (DUF1043 family)
MKRLLLAVLAGAAIAYGAYRYYGIVPELRAREVQEGQKVLEQTKERLEKSSAEEQKHLDEAAKVVEH